MKGIISLALCLVISFFIVPANVVMAADPTTSVTVIKYATDNTTIISQKNVTWEWMRDNLPVYGDGTTHYYFQGPTFDDSSFDALWDPNEIVNIDSRDYGACKGTDVKDLCDLVGGAESGDVIKIKSPDGFNKSFDYEDIYTPEPEQGKMIVTWYTKDAQETGDGYVPDYATGMRLIFFPETTNPEGKLVFGLWDMHETLAESRWHYYYDGKMWPSSSGLSVKWVSYIEIYNGKKTDIETENNQEVEFSLTLLVSGSGITTPIEGKYSYVQGTIADITATPASGWQFTSWSGDIADPNSATTTVTMNGDKTVTANFAEKVQVGKSTQADDSGTPDSEVTDSTVVREEASAGIPWYLILAIAIGVIALITVLVFTMKAFRKA